MLATYCLLLFLHPSGLLDFGAPNPGRHHIACSQCQGGGLLGGITLALEGWRCWPQRVGVVETQQKSTEVSSRGECNGEGWVLTSSMVSFSWWFSGGLVLSSSIYGILISSMWEESTVGRAIVSKLPSTNLCIFSSSLMCPARSGVLAGLVGEFLVNST